MLEVSHRSAKLAEEIYSREEMWTAQDHIGRALVGLGKPAEARNSFLAAIAGIEDLAPRSCRRRTTATELSREQAFAVVRHGRSARVAAEICGSADVCRTIESACVARRAANGPRKSAPVVVQRRTASRRAATSKLVSLNSQLTNESRREKPDVARVAELKSAVEKARLEYEDSRRSFTSRVLSSGCSVAKRRSSKRKSSRRLCRMLRAHCSSMSLMKIRRFCLSSRREVSRSCLHFAGQARRAGEAD